MTGPEQQPDAPLEATVQALSRLVDRVLRRVEHVDGRVSGLADVVTDLALKLSPARTHVTADHDAEDADEPAGPGVRSWLLADDPAQAEADLADLTAWVWRVYLWWPEAWLPSCWLWHPEVIEELWWLRVAHAEAYCPETGSSLRVADWHERHRPGVSRRVGTILRSCELTRHVPFNGRPIEVTPPNPPALARFAPTVAAVWTAGAGLDAVRAPGPEPTAEHLAEADAFQRSLYRSRR